MTRRFGLIAGGGLAIGAIAAGLVPRSETDRDASRVVAVHAGGGAVPSNLLRVYVELSAPMEPGSAHDHIRLVDDSGRVMAGAFLELREELWSNDHRRLTLWFDPGRVKRGIQSNLEFGSPLVAGREYAIVIDSSWRDAANRPLASTFTQRLRVGAFDSISPDPTRWSISSPRVGSRDALRVDFGESLDHGLASRMISVLGASNAPLAGHVTLSDADRVWRFTPAAPWRREGTLRVNPALEDLAGNNLARRFDVDRSRGDPSIATAMTDTAPRLIRVRMERFGKL